MTPATPRRALSLVMVGVVAAGSVGLVSARSLQATVAADRVERLQRVLQSEFSQAGEALRGRLTRENAGDQWGAQRAAEVAAAHRARYLAVRRELSALIPAVPVVARRSPFVPDAKFAQTKDANLIAASYGLRVTPTRQRLAVGTPRPAWDLYRSRDDTNAGPEAKGEEEGLAATRSTENVHPSWGMYGRPLRSSAAVVSPAQAVKTSASFDEAIVNGAAPSPPFFVYRDPTGGTPPR